MDNYQSYLDNKLATDDMASSIICSLADMSIPASAPCGGLKQPRPGSLN